MANLLPALKKLVIILLIMTIATLVAGVQPPNTREVPHAMGAWTVGDIDHSSWLITRPVIRALNVPRRDDEACHWLEDPDVFFYSTDANGNATETELLLDALRNGAPWY